MIHLCKYYQYINKTNHKENKWLFTPDRAGGGGEGSFAEGTGGKILFNRLRELRDHHRRVSLHGLLWQ